MQYVDVPQSEAEDEEGNILPGYEKWAYSWKRVIPDTPEEIAVREAQAQVLIAAKTDMKALPGWSTWTGAQAESWINTNVTDLASAKTALKAMAKAIVYLRDHSQITR
jgi:hypothetical protein